MADKSFQIPPSERREPKRFEPPPWERDAFEEMERKRREAEEAASTAQEQEPEEASPSEAPQQAGTAPVETGPGAAEVPPADGEPKGSRQATAKPAIEDKQVAAMLAELAAEEPKPDRAISAVTLGVAVVLFALGAMMIMWGMAGFVAGRGSGMQATAAATVLFLFGAGFVGGAIYLAVKSLQKRGVL